MADRLPVHPTVGRNRYDRTQRDATSRRGLQSTSDHEKPEVRGNIVRKQPPSIPPKSSDKLY